MVKSPPRTPAVWNVARSKRGTRPKANTPVAASVVTRPSSATVGKPAFETDSPVMRVSGADRPAVEVRGSARDGALWEEPDIRDRGGGVLEQTNPVPAEPAEVGDGQADEQRLIDVEERLHRLLVGGQHGVAVAERRRGRGTDALRNVTGGKRARRIDAVCLHERDQRLLRGSGRLSQVVAERHVGKAEDAAVVREDEREAVNCRDSHASRAAPGRRWRRARAPSIVARASSRDGRADGLSWQHGDCRRAASPRDRVASLDRDVDLPARLRCGRSRWHLSARARRRRLRARPAAAPRSR